MKAYVLGNRVDVEFGPQPSSEFRYALRELAVAVCRDLNTLAVHSGNHHCSFAVDALHGGDFGIICVCHPLSLFIFNDRVEVKNESDC